MDTVASAFTSLIKTLNLLPHQDAKVQSAIDKTTDKVYGFAALMEFGLHPMRNKYTKYKTDYFAENKNIFKFSPMEPNNLFKSATQGISRFWFGASQKDLFIMDEELITVIRRYAWDKDYQADMCVFLQDIVKPGLAALRKTYEKKETETEKPAEEKKEENKSDSVINHINNWIKVIDCAFPCCSETNVCLQNKCSLEDPCKTPLKTSLEIFCEKIDALIIPEAKSEADIKSNAFFENCKRWVRVEDNTFGKQIKNILSVERLQTINKIYTQSVISRMNASQEEIKQANETFNQFIIGPVEEQIELLHKDFVALHVEATLPYQKPSVEVKPQQVSSTPLEISRPGGVRRPITPKTTPTNSISTSPIKPKDKDDPLASSGGPQVAPTSQTQSANSAQSEAKRTDPTSHDVSGKEGSNG